MESLFLSTLSGSLVVLWQHKVLFPSSLHLCSQYQSSGPKGKAHLYDLCACASLSCASPESPSFDTPAQLLHSWDPSPTGTELRLVPLVSSYKVVCGLLTELSLLCPSHLAHSCSLVIPGVVTRAVSLSGHAPYLLLPVGNWPFCTLLLCAGNTPHRLGVTASLWGRRGIEEVKWYRLQSDRALLCPRQLLMHSLLMAALLGLITFTDHCALIPSSW